MSGHMTTGQQMDAVRKIGDGRVPLATRRQLLADLVEARYEDGMVRIAYNILRIVTSGLTGDTDDRENRAVLQTVADHCAAVFELSLPPEEIFAEMTR